MPGSDHDSNVGQFEERLRRWGGRPPSLAPAFAASRVVGQLRERGAATPWLRLAAVAAMMVAIAVGVWRTAPQQQPLAAAVAANGSGATGDVVQFWLDPETPVYFVLQPFKAEKGERS